MSTETVDHDIRDITLADKGRLRVEWAERAPSLMPDDRLWIRLNLTDQTSRTMQLSAEGERHTQLLETFRQAAFGA